MKPNEKAQFIQMLTAVSEVYGKKMSPALCHLYWLTLLRFELLDIKQAIVQHLNNPNVGQFMPKPADIIRYLEGDAETQALHAWAKVESAIRHVGAYESIVFDDYNIHAVIADMGGWSKICGTLTKDMPFCANEFMKRYQGFLQKKGTRHPSYFPGVIEHNNQVSGYIDSNTHLTFVGDERRALGVMLEGKEQLGLNINRKLLKARDLLEKNLSSALVAIDAKEDK